MTREDTILPGLLASGDEKLIAHIQSNYANALFGVITYIVKEREIAEDVFQESLVKIWKNSSRYDSSKGRPYTWLVNICRNTAIDKLRSKGFKMSQKTHIDGETVLINEEDRSMGINPDTMDVRTFPQKLRPEYRTVIELIYFGGYTQKEVSEELDIPLGTIKTRTRAALKELRELLSGNE